MRQLPVLTPWRCEGRGDCCSTGSVEMTPAERVELEAVSDRAVRPLQFMAGPEGRVVMVGTPCAFFTAEKTCAAYEVRPLLCRRFACGRVNETEPFVGIANMGVRLQMSRPFRSWYRRDQKQHTAWAKDHGWTDTREL